MITVFVADDHAVVRAGLQQIMAAHRDIRLIGEAAHGNELMRLLDSQAKVLVLDMSMPGRSGVDLIREVRAAWPRLRIVVHSMHNEEQYAVRAIRAGAHAYITKTRPPEELVDAIRQVAAGRIAVTPQVAERLAHGDLITDCGRRHGSLSDREHEVFIKLAQGATVTAIARDLCVSSKTISSHKARIMTKLGLTSFADLVRHAVEEGLGRPDSPPQQVATPPDLR